MCLLRSGVGMHVKRVTSEFRNRLSGTEDIAHKCMWG